MNSKKNLLDVIKVVFSNSALLLAGVVTSFVLPKFFSIEDFGYYKIFNLYTTYIIIFQFGISEGLYLKYGGKSLRDIDKAEFSSSFKAVAIMNVGIGLIIAVASIMMPDIEYRFIFQMIAIDITAVNITNLYQYLSQAVQRFTELSFRNVIKSLLIIGAVVAIALINRSGVQIGYRIYVIALVVINMFLMGWYCCSYKSILIRTALPTKKAIGKLIKTGFPLCLANIISSLILTMDRQVVSIFFTTTEYAIYAFAYSLLTLASTIITSVAVVIFPMFKQKSKEMLIREYERDVSLINVAVAVIVLMYFPLCIFIRTYLPSYADSLGIFRIIIPGLMISSPISIVIHNYYKAFNRNFDFFIRSALILGISIVANIIAYFIFGTMESISYASIAVMICWYFIEESNLRKLFTFHSGRAVMYMASVCISFYISTVISSLLVGFAIYLILIMGLTVALQRENLLFLMNRLLSKRRN